MSMKSILGAIGLDETEAKVYQALIERGAAGVSTIARRADLHRPAVYEALDALEAKDLIQTSREGKRKIYDALSPECLESKIEEIRSSLQSEYQEMVARYKTRSLRPQITFREGRSSIRDVFNDIVNSLHKNETFYRYSSRKRDSGKGYLSPSYRKKRDQKGIQRKVIASKSLAGTKKPRLERTIKTVPEEFDLFDQDITQLIYGNKVAFVDFNSETTLVIENTHVAEFQRKIFELLYSRL